MCVHVAKTCIYAFIWGTKFIIWYTFLRWLAHTDILPRLEFTNLSLASALVPAPVQFCWQTKNRVEKLHWQLVHCRITVKTVLVITTDIEYNSFVYYIKVYIPSHVLLLMLNFSSRGALHIAAFAWHSLRYKTPLLPHTGLSRFSHCPSSLQTHSPLLHSSPIPSHLIPKQAVRWEEFRISFIAL